MISKRELLAELEASAEDEEKAVVILSGIIKKKVKESSLPEKYKSELSVILEMLKKDSLRHYEELSKMIAQLEE